MAPSRAPAGRPPPPRVVQTFRKLYRDARVMIRYSSRWIQKAGQVGGQPRRDEASNQGKSVEHGSPVVSFLQRRHAVSVRMRGAANGDHVSAVLNLRSLRTRDWRSCPWRLHSALMNKERVCVRAGLLWAALGWRPGPRSPCPPSCRCGSTRGRSDSTESCSISNG